MSIGGEKKGWTALNIAHSHTHMHVCVHVCVHACVRVFMCHEKPNQSAEIQKDELENSCVWQRQVVG